MSPAESPSFASGLATRPRHTMTDVLAKREGPRAVHLTRMSGWAGLVALTVFLLIGLVTRLPDDAGQATAGVLVAFTASVPLFLARSRRLPLCAGVATCGVVLLGNADSRDIGWFAVLVLAAWCVLAGGPGIGVTYWVVSVLLFGRERLVAAHDPGWGA